MFFGFILEFKIQLPQKFLKKITAFWGLFFDFKYRCYNRGVRIIT